MTTEKILDETYVFFVRFEDKGVAQTRQKKQGGTLIVHDSTITFKDNY